MIGSVCPIILALQYFQDSTTLLVNDNISSRSPSKDTLDELPAFVPFQSDEVKRVCVALKIQTFPRLHVLGTAG